MDLEMNRKDATVYEKGASYMAREKNKEYFLS